MSDIATTLHPQMRKRFLADESIEGGSTMVRIKVPGSVYRRASGRWTAQSPETYDSDKQQWRRASLGTFDTKEEAEEELRRFNHSAIRGKALSSAETLAMRLDQYLDWWVDLVMKQSASGDLAARTASGYESAVRLHIRPALGRHKVRDLDDRKIVAWLAGLRSRGLADRSVLRIFRTLHRAFSDSPLPDNPVRLPKHLRPRVQHERTTYRPGVEEIREFLNHTSRCEGSEYLHPLWRLAATSGMRRGELVAIEWSDLDLDAWHLRITRSIVMDGGRVIVKGPKSKAGERVVSLEPEFVLALRTLRRRFSADQVAFGDDYEVKPHNLDLVFRWSEQGDLCRPDRLSHRFKAEWAHAGLDSPATLHGLRHSFGSLLLSRGHSVTETAAQMGHDPHVLLAIYARDLDEDARLERVGSTVRGLFS